MQSNAWVRKDGLLGGVETPRCANTEAGFLTQKTMSTNDTQRQIGSEQTTISGIIVAGDEGTILDEGVGSVADDQHQDDVEAASETERPEDCECISVDVSLPCWACYRDGFDSPNPTIDEEAER